MNEWPPRKMHLCSECSHMVVDEPEGRTPIDCCAHPTVDAACSGDGIVPTWWARLFGPCGDDGDLWAAAKEQA